MSYEPIYERFEVVGPDGNRLAVEFVRAGFLAQGDRPELFFFRVTARSALVHPEFTRGSPPKQGEETVVGISGSSLARGVRALLKARQKFERGRRRLTCQQKY
jgi:hypothetical protein